MGALFGASKEPLGEIGAILRAAYAEDVESLRLEHLREAAAIDRRFENYSEQSEDDENFDEVLEADYNFWLKYSERLISRWSKKPEGLCAMFGCGRRVRRFAWHGACPEHHHGDRYSARCRPIKLLPGAEYFLQ